jgi:hypothetical protein
VILVFRIRFQQSLENINKRTDFFEHIQAEELKFGNLVFIETKNSFYHIYVLGDSRYLVSGGWFDKNKLSPALVKINGCTWGGNIIKTDTLAACGMHLEFNNRVVTSTIQKVIVFPGNGKN